MHAWEEKQTVQVEMVKRGEEFISRVNNLAAIFLKWLRHTTVTTLAAIWFLFHLRNKDFLQATWGLCQPTHPQSRTWIYQLRAHRAWLQGPVRESLPAPSPHRVFFGAAKGGEATVHLWKWSQSYSLTNTKECSWEIPAQYLSPQAGWFYKSLSNVLFWWQKWRSFVN